MKKLFLCLAIAAGSCTSGRYIPDRQVQLTLVEAYRETKINACGLPRERRTWHLILVTKKGDTLNHHYFTDSYAKQSWLRPGDKYTLSYRMQDSIHCAFPYIFAKLKWNK